MKIASYTALTQNRYGAFFKRTDIPCFGPEGGLLSPVYEARRSKMLGHLYFPDSGILIWMDANIKLRISESEAVKRYLGDADLAVFKHPARDCLYEEIKILRTDRRFRSDPWLMRLLEEQEKHYRSLGFPEKAGLWETNLILRRNIPRVNELFESWWAELCRWQFRDQVSFSHVLKNHPGVRFKEIIGEDIRTNPRFEYTQDKRLKTRLFNWARKCYHLLKKDHSKI